MCPVQDAPRRSFSTQHRAAQGASIRDTGCGQGVDGDIST